MKKRIKKKDKIGEFEIKFWKDWLYADLLKRLDMVEKLPFVRDVCNLEKVKMPDKIKKHAVTTMLNGFFEDLESAAYTKIRLEDKKNKS